MSLINLPCHFHTKILKAPLQNSPQNSLFKHCPFSLPAITAMKTAMCQDALFKLHMLKNYSLSS